MIAKLEGLWAGAERKTRVKLDIPEPSHKGLGYTRKRGGLKKTDEKLFKGRT